MYLVWSLMNTCRLSLWLYNDLSIVFPLIIGLYTVTTHGPTSQREFLHNMGLVQRLTVRILLKFQFITIYTDLFSEMGLIVYF